MAKKILIAGNELDLATLGQPGVIKSNTAHTLTGDDMGQLLNFTNASAVTLTIPTDKQAPDIKPGFTATILQSGAGKVTCSGAAGVTINAPGGSLGTRVRYTEIWVTKIDANLWNVNGDVG